MSLPAAGAFGLFAGGFGLVLGFFAELALRGVGGGGVEFFGGLRRLPRSEQRLAEVVVGGAEFGVELGGGLEVRLRTGLVFHRVPAETAANSKLGVIARGDGFVERGNAVGISARCSEQAADRREQRAVRAR